MGYFCWQGPAAQLARQRGFFARGREEKMWVVLSVVEGVAVNSDRRELFKVTPDA